MAIKTYSTSIQCAIFSGIPVPLSRDSRPREVEFDNWRKSAFTKLRAAVGVYDIEAIRGTLLGDVLEDIEKELVDVKVQNQINGTNFLMIVTDEMVNRINTANNGDYPFITWIPNDNGNLTG
jgi:predicted lipid-binding transport protein (Tim44 family)